MTRMTGIKRKITIMRVLISEAKIWSISLRVSLCVLLTLQRSHMCFTPIIADEEFELVENKRGKSQVWENFGLKKRKRDNDTDETFTACRKCNAMVKIAKFF